MSSLTAVLGPLSRHAGEERCVTRQRTASRETRVQGLFDSLHRISKFEIVFSKQLAGVDDNIPDVPGGRFAKDQNGHLTGKLFDAALSKITQSIQRSSNGELRQALKDQCMECASRGFTTVTELFYTPEENTDQILSEVAKDLPVRVALYSSVKGPEPNRTQPAFEDSEKLWEAGVKLMADGSPHCGTAAVQEPYFPSDLTEILGFPAVPSCGTLNFTDEKLMEAVGFYHQNGKQIAIHAHGERAVNQVISVYEKVYVISGVF